jgi:enamine deaminase RidA (YjgF/YER057c/UK114 family)
VKQQTKDTLEALDATLKSAGTSLFSAASVTVYLVDAADVAGMNEAYAQYFSTSKLPPPARTTVILTTPLALPEGKVEISTIGIPSGGARKAIQPEGWAKNTAPYSYAIQTGNTLFLSGIVSRDYKAGTVVKGDMAAQTKVVMDSAGEILKAAGMGFGDLVQSRVWYNAPNNRELNPVYAGYFAGVDPPTRAAVRAGLPGPDYLVEATFVAVKDPTRKVVSPPAAPAPAAPPPAAAAPAAPRINFLSPAIQVGKRLYISGMLGSTPENKGDAKAQTAATLDRIEAVLKAGGYQWSDVVDSLVYVTDMGKFQDMNAAYRERFPQAPPARATIGVGLGGDALVEIMFVAVK